MLEEATTVKIEGREYQVTRVFVSDAKAQETFWSRYFTMATRVLPNTQRQRRAVKHEECNSIPQAQH